MRSLCLFPAGDPAETCNLITPAYPKSEGAHGSRSSCSPAPALKRPRAGGGVTLDSLCGRPSSSNYCGISKIAQQERVHSGISVRNCDRHEFGRTCTMSAQASKRRRRSWSIVFEDTGPPQQRPIRSSSQISRPTRRLVALVGAMLGVALWLAASLDRVAAACRDFRPLSLSIFPRRFIWLVDGRVKVGRKSRTSRSLGSEPLPQPSAGFRRPRLLLECRGHPGQADTASASPSPCTRGSDQQRDET
jgi:hypothetical protein